MKQKKKVNIKIMKEELKKFAEYLQLKAWEEMDRDFTDFVDEYMESVIKESNFRVGTYSLHEKEKSHYCHWSEGLKMVIEKDGVTIKLEGKEIRKLVGSLPRTLGGVY